MLKAPIPIDEVRRLETLRVLNILDTDPEERFDRFTKFGKSILDVPIILISLVDESRQWFKSCIGLEATETPRDISFCGHAIMQDDTYIITDTLLDARFADNPLVVGAPHIRFYAGHPICATNGKKLGTFCAIDTKPRELSQSDLMHLKTLANMVEHEIHILEALASSQRVLRDSQNMLKSVIDTSLDGVIQMNASGMITMWNGQAEEIFGWTAQQALHHPLSETIIPLKHREGHTRGLKHLLATGEGPIMNKRIEIEALHSNGHEFMVELAITSVVMGEDVLFTAFIRDISEKKKSEERIWQQANFDSLTNLPNRRFFYDRLQSAINFANRRDASLALMMIDLDHFKEVNDNLGHQKGDLLLIEASSRMRACIRETDTLGRLGGDEFCIVFSDEIKSKNIDQIAQKLIDFLAKPIQLENDQVNITASIGIAWLSEDAPNIKALLKNADKAMYKSKKNGRNCFNYF